MGFFFFWDGEFVSRSCCGHHDCGGWLRLIAMNYCGCVITILTSAYIILIGDVVRDEMLVLLFKCGIKIQKLSV